MAVSRAVLVTGCSSGIGFPTSARLYITLRRLLPDRGRDALVGAPIRGRTR